jgi:hypothetical protein
MPPFRVAVVSFSRIGGSLWFAAAYTTALSAPAA